MTKVLSVMGVCGLFLLFASQVHAQRGNGRFDGTWQIVLKRDSSCKYQSTIRSTLAIKWGRVTWSSYNKSGRVGRAGNFRMSGPSVWSGSYLTFKGKVRGRSGTGTFEATGNCTGSFRLRKL